MKTIKFRTNFKCQGCINAVQPYLDDISEIESWKTDDKKDHKELIVHARESFDVQRVKQAVAEAGYEAEEKKPGLLGKLFG